MSFYSIYFVQFTLHHINRVPTAVQHGVCGIQHSRAHLQATLMDKITCNRKVDSHLGQSQYRYHNRLYRTCNGKILLGIITDIDDYLNGGLCNRSTSENDRSRALFCAKIFVD